MNDLSNLSRKRFLTTGEIARLLHLSRITIYKWVSSGKLKTSRVPGGKYRVLKHDFTRFLRNHQMGNGLNNLLIPHQEIKILIVDRKKKEIKALKSFLGKPNPLFHILGATNFLEAGKHLFSFKPDVLILDMEMPGIDFLTCRQIKSDPFTKHIKIIGMAAFLPKEKTGQMKKGGVDFCFLKSADFKDLAKEIEISIRQNARA